MLLTGGHAFALISPIQTPTRALFQLLLRGSLKGGSWIVLTIAKLGFFICANYYAQSSFLWRIPNWAWGANDKSRHVDISSIEAERVLTDLGRFYQYNEKDWNPNTKKHMNPSCSSNMWLLLDLLSFSPKSKHSWSIPSVQHHYCCRHNFQCCNISTTHSGKTPREIPMVSGVQPCGWASLLISQMLLSTQARRFSAHTAILIPPTSLGLCSSETSAIYVDDGNASNQNEYW